MKVAVFSAKGYDYEFLDAANKGRHQLTYFDCRLAAGSTQLAHGADAVCLFANDHADAIVIEALAVLHVRFIALRAAGFNNVDLDAAAKAGIAVGRVPAYSPHAVAEHAFALALSLIRKVHRAYNRVREGNFSLDGLLGFDLVGKTFGIVGTGNIGSVAARIARGFGCHVLATDPVRRRDMTDVGVIYVDLRTLLSESDMLSLHCPLNDTTRHLIDADALRRMKAGAILINTSRGAVIDTHAAIEALKRQQLGGLAIDVYEEEEALFFEDRSSQAIQDDQFARLLTFPQVLITGHQGFFTQEALANIAETTIANLDSFETTGRAVHPVVCKYSQAAFNHSPLAANATRSASERLRT